MNLQICTTAGEDLLLRDVFSYLVDSELIRVLYRDGRQQNYPLANVRWYGPEEPRRDALPLIKNTIDFVEFDDAIEFNYPAPSSLLHER